MPLISLLTLHSDCLESLPGWEEKGEGQMLKNGGVWYTSGTLSVCVHTGGFVKRFGQCASAIRIGWLHQDVLFGRKWRSRRLNVWADSGNSGRNRGRMRALSITRLLWEKRDRESEFLLCVFVFLSQFTRLQF